MCHAVRASSPNVMAHAVARNSGVSEDRRPVVGCILKARITGLIATGDQAFCLFIGAYYGSIAWERGYAPISCSHLLRPTRQFSYGENRYGFPPDAKAECLCRCIFILFVMAAKQPCHIIPARRSYITFYIPPSPRGKKERPVLVKVGGVRIHFLFYIRHHITANYSGVELLF